MKKTTFILRLYLIFALLINTIVFYGQNRQDYYIEIDSLYTFNVLSKTVNPDETLTFSLDDNNFESFLNSQDIFYFEKAYPTALTPRLQRVYIAKLYDSVNTNTFLSRNEIAKFFKIEEEEILTDELSPNYYPDDFMDYFEDFPNPDLMLIRAPLAWTITKGNPNMIFGLADTKYDFNHEDLQGKIVDHIVVINNSDHHGTGMATVLAGATNNDKDYQQKLCYFFGQ